MFSDKTFYCVECGYQFTFSAGEQQFSASRSYANEPKSKVRYERHTLCPLRCVLPCQLAIR
jgi:hypothetical protein